MKIYQKTLIVSLLMASTAAIAGRENGEDTGEGSSTTAHRAINRAQGAGLPLPATPEKRQQVARQMQQIFSPQTAKILTDAEMIKFRGEKERAVAAANAASHNETLERELNDLITALEAARLLEGDQAEQLGELAAQLSRAREDGRTQAEQVALLTNELDGLRADLERKDQDIAERIARIERTEQEKIALQETLTREKTALEEAQQQKLAKEQARLARVVENLMQSIAASENISTSLAQELAAAKAERDSLRAFADRVKTLGTAPRPSTSAAVNSGTSAATSLADETKLDL